MTFSRRAVVAVAMAATVLGSPAGAVAPAWTHARVIALPSNGVTVPQGYLPALACPAVGSCVAAGDFADFASNTYGMVVVEAKGVWKPAASIDPPLAAAASANLTPTATACGAVGSCVVVGSYQDNSGNLLAFADLETAGTWRGAQSVPLPADAATTQVAQLRAVTCAGTTTCTAVGTYTASGANSPVEGLVATEVNGVWHASSVELPGPANVDPIVTLSQVACDGNHVCISAGTYIDANGVSHGLGVTITGATVSGTSIRLPSNANLYPSVTIGSAACAGACVVTGTYVTASGAREGFALTATGGTWSPATMMVLPANAATSPHVFFYGFSGASCASYGNCTTGGQYRDASGRYEGFLVNQVHGVWRAATELKLPAGAQQAGKNGGVVAITCPVAGTCSAGAAYLDAKGLYQALIVTEVGTTWRAGTTLRLPKGATSVGIDGGVYGLVCPSAGHCSATGSYLDGLGRYQGFAASLG